jgi:P4 family phage/plasmid primase-like protien
MSGKICNENKSVLYDFMFRYRAEKGIGKPQSHTMMGRPFGKYNIPDNKYDKFIDLYQRAVDTCDGQMYVVERPKEISHLIIDIDWNYGIDNMDRLYDIDTIKNILSELFEIIASNFDVDVKKLPAYVLEKELPSVETNKLGEQQFKDGIHIMFPDFITDVAGRYLVLHELEKSIEEKGLFDDIPHTNTLHSIIDRCIVIDNGIVMFGSRKPDKQETKSYPYELTHLFNSKLTEIKLAEEEYCNLPTILSSRNCDESEMTKLSKDVDKNLVNEVKNLYINKERKTTGDNIDADKNYDNNEKIVDNDDKYSIRSKIDDELNMTDDDVRITNKIHAIKNGGDVDHKITIEEKNINLTKALIKILSKSRADDYMSWISVGWCLHNISDSLYGSWIKFSKKSMNKFDEHRCKAVWRNARDIGFGLPSLEIWAAKDNPKKYKQIKREFMCNELVYAESGTHYDIAKLIQVLYGHKYKCSSIKHKTLYEFQNHRWVEVDGGYTLDICISEQLTKEFISLMQYYIKGSFGNERFPRDDHNRRTSKIEKIGDNLKCNGFKQSVMDQCYKLFYEKGFEEKLDAKRHLLGFNNGVYDLEERVFRDGVPDDYITLSTGYDYKEFSPTDKKILEVCRFFDKLMPEEDMRTYVLSLISSYLDGFNRDQKFIIWTGFGSNGKSTAIELISMMLGEYFDELPITFLTRKQGSSSSATPELADKRGVRFVVLQEPEGDEQIYVGQMKNVTAGNDWVHCRPLYKDPIKFKPQFKMVLVCNKMPRIPSNDFGTWRRIRVTPWESRFLDLGEKIKNPMREFFKDATLSEKMEDWKSAFSWLLINMYYVRYRNDGLKEPPKVTLETANYKKKNDVYMEYITDELELTLDRKDIIPINDIWSQFKAWYRETHVGNVPQKLDFIEYLESKGVRKNRNVMVGIKVNDFGMDEDDFDHL